MDDPEREQDVGREEVGASDADSPMGAGRQVEGREFILPSESIVVGDSRSEVEIGERSGATDDFPADTEHRMTADPFVDEGDDMFLMSDEAEPAGCAPSLLRLLAGGLTGFFRSVADAVRGNAEE